VGEERWTVVLFDVLNKICYMKHWEEIKTAVEVDVQNLGTGVHGHPFSSWRNIMKQLITFLLMVLLVLVAASCNKGGGDSDGGDNETANENSNTPQVFSNCGGTQDPCDQIICAYQEAYQNCVDASGGQTCQSILACVETYYTCVCPGGNLDLNNTVTCGTNYATCVSGFQF
jgi:hypothetical protein